MKGRLTGKVAAVTGASSGIGQAIARALASEGVAVIGFARRFKLLAVPTPKPGKVTEVCLDVTDETAVKARFAELGDIDFLCCSAGVGIFSPIVDSHVADLRAMLEVHIVGSYLPAREMLAQRRAAGPRPGHIVNVSSVAAFRTFTSCGGYTAAKEGLRGLTRVLVEEARALGVRVTGLYPGATDTSIWDDRPGFDRTAMLKPTDVASLLIEVLVRPELAVEELLVMPPAGAL